MVGAATAKSHTRAESANSAYAGSRGNAPDRSENETAALSAGEIDALFANEWFCALQHDVQRALIEHAAIWHVPAHHTLGSQGSVPDVWFGIAAGAVRLSTTSPDGRETVLELLEPGQWFGDVPLLTGTALPYQARTWAPSTLLLMRRSVLRSLLSRHAELGPALLRLSWYRCGRLIERVVQQSEPKLEERARKMLLHLATRFGTPQRGGTRIDLALTQAQLGMLVQGSRQRVNAIIQDLERKGEIRRTHQFIECVDRQCSGIP